MHGLDKIHWGKNSWKRLSLIGDASHQSSKHKSLLCLLGFCVVPRKSSSTSGFQRSLEEQVAGIRSEKSYRDYDAVSGESTEFECNIFPGFTTLQLCDKINDLQSDLGQTPETFTGRILFMSMLNDISCDKRQQR